MSTLSKKTHLVLSKLQLQKEEEERKEKEKRSAVKKSKKI
jgi:hypothetical protein